jgi:hypothetical protein
MLAPIPPVPLPPTRPIPTQAPSVNSDSEAHRARRVQELLGHPELPDLFKEVVRIWKALPPKRIKQIRSDKQIAKRRPQTLQRVSYVRTSARAQAESRRIRIAEEVATLAQKRYQTLLIC